LVKREENAETGVDSPQDAAVSQFRHELVGRLLEAKEPFFDQRHRGHGGDGLGERGDPEDGVARQGGVIDEGRRADGVDVHIVAT